VSVIDKILSLAVCAALSVQMLSSQSASTVVARDDKAIVAHKASPTSEFLDSIGVGTSFPERGQPLEKTIDMIRYGGFRWVRAGIEGVTDTGPTTLQTFIDLHEATGVKFSWGLLSGGTEIDRLKNGARVMANHGALLAIEGNNEPNNWGVTYQGEKGGGREESWLAVARLQRDLYAAVKQDPVLRAYPVWSISAPGAQTENVGLQFLEIPAGAGTRMPDGTRYADYANLHNYYFHPHSPDPVDNKVWNAADPGVGSKVDGLYGNFSRTWRRGYRGYAPSDLENLPRVTTETGSAIEGKITEDIQAYYTLNMYLAQFARGFAHTAVYLLRDRTDEQGVQTFGFFDPQYQPRKSAHFLHNLTTILGSRPGGDKPGSLSYALAGRSDTVHDLALANGDGSHFLVVWGERVSGTDHVTVRLAQRYRSITVFDPTKGEEPVNRLGATDRVKLTVSNHPFILLLE